MSALDWCSVSLIIMVIMILTVLVVMCTCFCVLKRSFKNRTQQQQLLKQKQQQSIPSATYNQRQEDSDSNQTMNANVSCNFVDRVVSTLADVLLEPPDSNPNTLLLSPEQRGRLYPLPFLPFPVPDQHGNVYPWPYLPLPVPDQHGNLYPWPYLPLPVPDQHGNVYPWPYLPLPVPGSHAWQAPTPWSDFMDHEREDYASSGTSITRADVVGSNITRADIHKAQCLEMSIPGAGSSEANTELCVPYRTDGFKTGSRGKDINTRSDPKVDRRATNITRKSDPGNDIIQLCSSCSRVYRTYSSGTKSRLCSNSRTNDLKGSSTGTEVFRPSISRTDIARVFSPETDKLGDVGPETSTCTASRGESDIFNAFGRGTNISRADHQRTNFPKANNEVGTPKVLRPQTDVYRFSESRTFNSDSLSLGMDILKSSYGSDSLSDSSSGTSINNCFVSKTEVLGSFNKKASRSTVSYKESEIFNDSRTYVPTVAGSETDFLTASNGTGNLRSSSPTSDILRCSYSRTDHSEGPRQGNDIHRFPKSMVLISEGPSPGMEILKSSYGSDSLSDSSSGTSINSCFVLKTEVLGSSVKKASRSTVSYKESEVFNDSRTYVPTVAGSETDFLTASNGTGNLRSSSPKSDILRCSYSRTDYSEGPRQGNDIHRFPKSMVLISEGPSPGMEILKSSYGSDGLSDSSSGASINSCFVSKTEVLGSSDKKASKSTVSYKESEIFNDSRTYVPTFAGSETDFLTASNATGNLRSSIPTSDILRCSFLRTDFSEDPRQGNDIHRCSKSTAFISEGPSLGIDMLKSSYGSDSLSDSSSGTSITKCCVSKTDIGSSDKKASKSTVHYIESEILIDSRTYLPTVASSETDFITTSHGTGNLRSSRPTNDIFRCSYLRADFSEAPRQGYDIHRCSKSTAFIAEGPSPGIDMLKSSYGSDSLSDSSSGTSITKCCVSKTEVLGSSDTKASKSTASYIESEILKDSRRTYIPTVASSEADFLTASYGTGNLRPSRPTSDILRCSYPRTNFSEGPRQENDFQRCSKSMTFISEGPSPGSDIFQSSYGNENLRCSSPGNDFLRCSYSGTDLCVGQSAGNDILNYSHGKDNFIASSSGTYVVRSSRGNDNIRSSSPGTDIPRRSYSRTDVSEDQRPGTDIPMSSYGNDKLIAPSTTNYLVSQTDIAEGSGGETSKGASSYKESENF